MSKPAALWGSNYQAGVQNGQAKYEQGVENPSRSWSAELTASKPKMRANFLQALDAGHFENGVSKVGDAGWKSATKAKANNYSAAATIAAQKYQARVNEMKAVIDSVQQSVNAMPRVTHQDAMNRMVANATGIRDAWLAKKGG